uniref:non-specific serine/threonine protein kinase n=1 Tax=Kalanchoe fedtschenkoi TaxID=63787 RepID=A0A7N0V972_KALFE
MVSSHFPSLNKTSAVRSIQSRFPFPVHAPDAVSTDHLELDFSDVFGPVPIQSLEEVSPQDFDNTVAVTDVTNFSNDEPAVVFNRSHSLVGPSSCLSQSIKLSKIALHESQSSLDLDDDDEKFESVFEASDEDRDKGLIEIGSEPVKAVGVSLDDFEVLKIVGQGAFGRVYQVRKKGTTDIYAMKVMRKDRIMEKNHAGYMKAERDILTKIDHPYIVQLRYSFQTKYRLYLVLDFVNGGHLFFQLYHHGLFREELARIYAAEIVSAVSHLHANGIMHRDLKPENILLDADGHAMLTDFGLAKQFEENTRSNSLCGTVEYMAPEIVLGKGYDNSADWWSVGILLYEMLTGKPPFLGNRDKIQQRIVKEKIKLPTFLTGEAHSLLKGLLNKDASKRLGSGATGSDNIKHHKWFKPINWKKLDARQIQPSFRPEVSGQHCIANFEKKWTDMPLLDSPIASPKENPFVGFSYVKPAGSFLQRESPAC